jgi:hypothetical protein
MSESSYSGSGGIRQFYGVIIRDKCKTADANTLRAYKTVANDLLKDAKGSEVEELKSALAELDKALGSKS